MMDDLPRLVWIRNNENRWVKCKLLSHSENGICEVEHNEEILKVPEGLIYEANEEQDHNNVFDLIQLKNLNEPTIIDIIKERYIHDQIYTAIGSSVLVSVNPYKSIKTLYNNASINSYRQQNNNLNTLPPHLYAIAQNAFDAVLTKRKSQSIIVTGESGAGKTEATKHILRYMALIQQSRHHDSHPTPLEKKSASFSESINTIYDDIDLPPSHEILNQWNTNKIFSLSPLSSPSSPSPPFSPSEQINVEQLLVLANPILESFGNATTVRNDNSSRFGKFIKIYFNQQTGILNSASVSSYLLESCRVVHPPKNERNFHVFYQFLSSLSHIDPTFLAECDISPLLSPQDFSITRTTQEVLVEEEEGEDSDFSLSGGLSPSSLRVSVEEKDRNAFLNMLLCLDALGILRRRECRELFRILVGLLYLGNVEFVEDVESKCGCLPRDTETLKKGAANLGLPYEKLLDTLCVRTVIDVQTTHPIYIKNDISTANDIRDTIIITIYNKLFDWILQEINACMSSKEERRGEEKGGDERGEEERRGERRGERGDEGKLFIGLLDIYGFENVLNNSFEQLCINFANEKLQNLFNYHIFDAETKIYQQEGIDISYVSFYNNNKIMDSFVNKNCGFFPLLDSECISTMGTDASLLSKVKEEKIPYEYIKRLTGKKSTPFSSVLPPTLSPSLSSPSLPSPPLSDLPYIFRSSRLPNQFIVRHYANDVLYNIQGMLEKNKQNLSSCIIELILFSSHRLLSKGCPSSHKQLLKKNIQKIHSPSLSKTFTTQLNDLVQLINSTNQYYIRCIKPNNNKLPNHYNHLLSKQQLLSSGVIESVKIRSFGFPIRFLYKHFVHKYRFFLKRGKSGGEEETKRGEIGEIKSIIENMESLQLDEKLSKIIKQSHIEELSKTMGKYCVQKKKGSSGVQIGKTYVFMKEDIYTALEKIIRSIRNYSRDVIYRHWMGYREKKRFSRVRRALRECVVPATRSLLSRAHINALPVPVPDVVEKEEVEATTAEEREEERREERREGEGEDAVSSSEGEGEEEKLGLRSKSNTSNSVRYSSSQDKTTPICPRSFMESSTTISSTWNPSHPFPLSPPHPSSLSPSLANYIKIEEHTETIQRLLKKQKDMHQNEILQLKKEHEEKQKHWETQTKLISLHSSLSREKDHCLLCPSLSDEKKKLQSENSLLQEKLYLMKNTIQQYETTINSLKQQVADLSEDCYINNAAGKTPITSTGYSTTSHKEGLLLFEKMIEGYKEEIEELMKKNRALEGGLALSNTVSAIGGMQEDYALYNKRLQDLQTYACNMLDSKEATLTRVMEENMRLQGELGKKKKGLSQLKRNYESLSALALGIEQEHAKVKKILENNRGLNIQYRHAMVSYLTQSWAYFQIVEDMGLLDCVKAIEWNLFEISAAKRIEEVFPASAMFEQKEKKEEGEVRP